MSKSFINQQIQLIKPKTNLKRKKKTFENSANRGEIEIIERSDDIKIERYKIRKT